MKRNKNILILLAMLITPIIGCSIQTSKKEVSETVSEKAIPIEDIAYEKSLKNIEAEKPDIEPKQDSSEPLIIQNPNIQIQFPSGYYIEKSQEENRRGSYLSYDFFSKDKQLHDAWIDEIQFFSIDSIQHFTKDCGTVELGPCFFGDYPDQMRYEIQKKAFAEKKDYTEGYDENNVTPIQKIGDRHYFVRYLPSPNGSHYEYTTFIDDVKIDIWIGANISTLDGSENDELRILSKNIMNKISLLEL